jgi:superfamily I DNA and RNA helicase
MFTAFTRSKAWLRVSGIGPNASRFFAEITAAKSHLPNVEFILPDLRQVDLIQRDLSDRTDKLKRAREEYLAQLAEIGFSEEEAEEALQGFSHEPKRI